MKYFLLVTMLLTNVAIAGECKAITPEEQARIDAWKVQVEYHQQKREAEIKSIVDSINKAK